MLIAAGCGGPHVIEKTDRSIVVGGNGMQEKTDLAIRHCSERGLHAVRAAVGDRDDTRVLYHCVP